MEVLLTAGFRSANFIFVVKSIDKGKGSTYGNGCFRSGRSGDFKST